MTIHHDCQQPAQQAVSKLKSLLTADRPTLFLSAGGSSLKMLVELTDFTGWQQTTVTTLDERITDAASDRNFHQLQQTPLVQKYKSKIDFIDPLPDPNMQPTEAGGRFADKLTQWQQEHQSGQIIATVGIGEDGHIAGMIPTKEQTFRRRFQSDALAVGYADQNLNNEFKKRITTTMTFMLKHLDQAVVYAAGERKCSVLEKLTRKNGKVWSQPAEMLKQISADLFTDCNLSESGL